MYREQELRNGESYIYSSTDDQLAYDNIFVMYNVTGKARARKNIKILQKGLNNFKYHS